MDKSILVVPESGNLAYSGRSSESTRGVTARRLDDILVWGIWTQVYTSVCGEHVAVGVVICRINSRSSLMLVVKSVSPVNQWSGWLE